jgi:hypothetical protein
MIPPETPGEMGEADRDERPTYATRRSREARHLGTLLGLGLLAAGTISGAPYISDAALYFHQPGYRRAHLEAALVRTDNRYAALRLRRLSGGAHSVRGDSTSAWWQR